MTGGRFIKVRKEQVSLERIKPPPEIQEAMDRPPPPPKPEVMPTFSMTKGKGPMPESIDPFPAYSLYS